MRKLKILVGCEESQAVTIELRKLGHEAYSCDLLTCSGGHPEWHIQGDVFKAIEFKYFTTENGDHHKIDKWDAGIFHPTCTFLTNSGVRWLYNHDKSHNSQRWKDLGDAIYFFNRIVKECIKSGIEKFALENPIPHKYAVNGVPGVRGIGKYSQLIQPYEYGHLEKKATCLWLYGLPELKPTNNVYEEMMLLPYPERAKIHYASPGPERAKIRSKTYSGIAGAMATQWTEYILNP